MDGGGTYQVGGLFGFGGWWGTQQPLPLCHDQSDGHLVPLGGGGGEEGPPSGKQQSRSPHQNLSPSHWPGEAGACGVLIQAEPDLLNV